MKAHFCVAASTIVRCHKWQAAGMQWHGLSRNLWLPGFDKTAVLVPLGSSIGAQLGTFKKAGFSR
jgi:hypothetical protein